MGIDNRDSPKHPDASAVWKESLEIADGFKEKVCEEGEDCSYESHLCGGRNI
jgi:hypothetical protein